LLKEQTTKLAPESTNDDPGEAKPHISGGAMTESIPLIEIEPWSCSDNQGVLRRVAMLQSGEQLPPILVVRQSGKYRFRIFDGKHRARAAQLAGRVAIDAIILAT
jgi:hypothetical protein